MKKIYFISICILVSFVFSTAPISLLTKTRGSVKTKTSMESIIFTKARINKPIFDNNVIKTKSNSFFKMKYLDGRSTISTFSNSEISVYGIVDGDINNKTIDLINGIVKVEVNEEFNKKFKLITSNSELSCNECSYWAISDVEKGDSFFHISGMVNIVNLFDSTATQLFNDTTVISLSNVGLEKLQTTINEKEYLESLLINVDEFSDQSNQNIENTKISSNNELVIKLKNAQNIERKIYLTYTK